jgi:hypothetical protein
MRERGIGRHRWLAIAAVLVALSVAAPELAAPVGAATARSSGRTEMQSSRPAARDTLAAKRRRKKRRALSSAQRKAKLVKYLRSHPKVVAQHLRTSGVKIRPSALRKNPKLIRAYLKKHPKKKLGAKGAKFTPKKKLGAKGAKKGAKKATKKGAKKTGAAALAAARKKAKKNATKGHPLGLTGWGEIALLAMLPLLAVGALLFITDRLRQPPKPPTPKRRRRTLVITPLSRNR